MEPKFRKQAAWNYLLVFVQGVFKNTTTHAVDLGLITTLLNSGSAYQLVYKIVMLLGPVSTIQAAIIRDRSWMTGDKISCYF